MATSCFVIMVQGDRAPLLLGPMSEEMRQAHMPELRQRHGPDCGLHALDVTADGLEQVSATVNRVEQ